MEVKVYATGVEESYEVTFDDPVPQHMIDLINRMYPEGRGYPGFHMFYKTTEGVEVRFYPVVGDNYQLCNIKPVYPSYGKIALLQWKFNCVKEDV